MKHILCEVNPLAIRQNVSSFFEKQNITFDYVCINVKMLKQMVQYCL